jgi:hypothetical protein
VALAWDLVEGTGEVEVQQRALPSQRPRGPVALSVQNERHRIPSRIWDEADERPSDATVRARIE